MTTHVVRAVVEFAIPADVSDPNQYVRELIEDFAGGRVLTHDEIIGRTVMEVLTRVRD